MSKLGTISAWIAVASCQHEPGDHSKEGSKQAKSKSLGRKERKGTEEEDGAQKRKDYKCVKEQKNLQGYADDVATLLETLLEAEFVIAVAGKDKERPNKQWDEGCIPD